MKTTQKNIIDLAKRLGARNLNDYSEIKGHSVQDDYKYMDLIAYSAGMYGRNAGIWKDSHTNEFWYTPCRSTYVFMLM